MKNGRKICASLLPLGAVLAAMPQPAIAQADSDHDRIARLELQVQQLTAELAAVRAGRDGAQQAAALPAAAPPPAPAGAPIQPLAQAPGQQPAADSHSLSAAAAQPPTPVGRSLGSAGPSVTLNASTAGGSAVVTVGHYPTTLHRNGSSNWYSATTEELEFSAPVGDSGGATPITVLDALADGAKIKFRFSRYLRQIGTGETTADMDKRLVAAQLLCTNDTKPDRLPRADCTDVSTRQEVLQHYDPGALQQFTQTSAPGKFGFAYGFSAGLGYKKFSYVDAASFSNPSASRLGVEGGLFVSLLPNFPASSLTLSFDYQHAFKDAKTGILCPATAPAGSTSFSCLSGPQGLPVRDNRENIGLDYRVWLGTLPLIGRAAISPQFTYDVGSRTSAIDFPIYFVPDDKGHLLGGIRFGYSTDDKNFVAGVFVSAPFSIFH